MLHEIILVSLLILLLGEYIPLSRKFWQGIGHKLQKFGTWILEEYENRLYSSKEEWIEVRDKKLTIQNFFARVFFFITAIIVVLFLEIFWELGFKKTSDSFQKSRIAAFFEGHVKEMNKYVILALFGIPFILMEVLGFVAVGFLASGHIFIFIGLYLFKVLFFIPVHFILHVGEDKLMEIPWFERRYKMVMAVLEWFKKSQTYVKVHNFSENIGSYIRGFKNLFSSQVVNMKKAFEGDDLLSEECEAIRKEITEAEKKEGREKVEKALYVKFIDCINKHLNENIKVEK